MKAVGFIPSHENTRRLSSARMIRTIVLVFALTLTLSEKLTADVTTTSNSTEEEVFAQEISTVESPTTLEAFDGEYVTSKIKSDLAESRQVRSDGGANISIKYYPYVVALYDYEGEYMCVGTILTPRLILTANHCLYPNPIYSIRVNSSDIYFGGDKYWVKSIIKYPGAKDEEVEPDDIAMLFLKMRIRNAHPVKLIEPQIEVPEEGIVRGVGWGRTRAGYPRRLIHVNLEITPVAKCEEEYFGGTWICTESKRSDTCNGDSGGPILYEYKKSFYQVGIVSHSSEKLCRTGQPAANSNVKKYLGWIHSYTKNPKFQ